MSRLQFQVQATSPGSRARAGRFQTLHGEVETPVFMPVGTQATVRTQTVESLREVGSRVLLANTYHLMLRPGPGVFERMGGIHRFMNWDGPVLTDSGGFQIFSLPHSRRMNEAGAQFQSYVDRRFHLLSPETSIRMQRSIGSDIMMVLDQCIPSTAGHEEALAAMELTHRWAVRSLAAREDSPQALFGIVQGACHRDLRARSAEFLTGFPFDGYAIGGLAVGEGTELRNEFTEFSAGLLPEDRPRYLMGVGTPLDLLEAVHRGVDMFDCILPTQLAQRGTVFTSHGKLQLRRTVHRLSEERLDADCPCPTCARYSRAYLHHLIKCEEVLGWQLLAHHNLTFYHRLMREMRGAILNGTFAEYHARRRPELMKADEDNPVVPPRRSRSRGERNLKLGDYEVQDSPHGWSSIRQISSGEIMHSVSAPDEEARRLYVEQSRLAERLATSGNPGESETVAELVIWDVGLGAATNAMAALRCVEGAGTASRPVRLVSFERDLDPLRLALKHPDRFVHLRHGAPHRLLETGVWKSPDGRIQWELLHGDFLNLLESAPIPELIFHDPFSRNVDAPLWTAELFTRLRAHCGGRETCLFTYSNSTAVRAALLAAGFFVARGVGTGPKSETTIAVSGTRADSSEWSWLGAEWLDRWRRSGARFPEGLTEAERREFARRIEEHLQFRQIPAGDRPGP